MVGVAERHQYFELVEDQGVAIVVGDDVLGMWPQCIMYPVVQRRVMIIHAFQNLHHLSPTLKQVERQKNLYGGHILLTFFAELGGQQVSEKRKPTSCDRTQSQRIEQKRCGISLQLKPQDRTTARFFEPRRCNARCHTG